MCDLINVFIYFCNLFFVVKWPYKKRLNGKLYILQSCFVKRNLFFKASIELEKLSLAHFSICNSALMIEHFPLDCALN